MKQFVCNDCWEIFKKALLSCTKCWWDVEEYDWGKDIKIISKIKSKEVTFVNPEDFNIKEQDKYEVKEKLLNDLFWGWLTKWSATLITWDPWNGKSTLFAQISSMIDVDWKIAYFSWEESESQSFQRFVRLWIEDTLKDKVLLKYSWEVETILASIESEKIDLLFIDSVQTLYSNEISWNPWNKAQIEYCTWAIINACKLKWITVIMAVQITKWWVIAWPKTLEHAWDCTIYIQKEEFEWKQIRLFKVEKNRFWSTDVVITAEMKENWFHFISQKEAAELFIKDSEIKDEDTWFCFSTIVEWSSPFFVEVQAITTQIVYEWANPIRRSSWYSQDRLHQIIAVLEKYWLWLSWMNVFINVVWKSNTYDSDFLDLSVAIALISAKEKKNYWKKMIAYWEIWLRWEIRNVRYRDLIDSFVKKSWFEKIRSKSNWYSHISDLLKELIE